MKLKRGIPLIDQHNQSGFWGGKFGGSFIPETLKKPVEDLTALFGKLRCDRKLLKQKDFSLSSSLINHERIHLQQQLMLLPQQRMVVKILTVSL